MIDAIIRAELYRDNKPIIKEISCQIQASSHLRVSMQRILSFELWALLLTVSGFVLLPIEAILPRQMFLTAFILNIWLISQPKVQDSVVQFFRTPRG
jgi:hypothetical protein